MVEEEDAYEDIDGEYDEYVLVVIARNADEVEKYRQVLEDHDIPVITGDDERGDGNDRRPPRSLAGGCVRILVPEPLLDEASETIANMDETDECALSEEDLDEEEDEEEELGLVDEVEPDLEDDDLFDEDAEEDEDS